MNANDAPTRYERELENFGDTFSIAINADISRLRRALVAASELSIIGVGSGGSFTAAALLCHLHEKFTGRVSRPSTPLELISQPNLAAASPVFLISAEGQNPDIVEALIRARTHSARTIHVLSNRKNSLLTERIASLSGVEQHICELTEKDGYLATNSLLLNIGLIARAYSEEDGSADTRKALEELTLDGVSIDQWLESLSEFAGIAATRQSLVVVYSPLLRPIATDLESKLSESALMHCQLADLRTFAHGRHLWLADRAGDCSILALVEPSLTTLWESTRNCIPSSIPCVSMPVSGGQPWDLVAGIVAGMKFLGMLAACVKKDLARPSVPQFGRDLYYMALSNIIPPPKEDVDRGEESKREVIGWRWPSQAAPGPIRRALDTFASEIERQAFRSIVFDYDGTLCSSQRRDEPPIPEITKHLSRLAQAGIIIGVASGRGGSIVEHLHKSIASNLWPLFRLGLYNGGRILSLAETGLEALAAPVNSEFISHVERILHRLARLGVPIQEIRPTQPYQVSARFQDGVSTDQMWFVVADALRQAGLDLSRMVRSKHSIDVLEQGVTKSLLIADIIQHGKVTPYQILCIGDQGAWPGNDCALLEHKFSLSVDSPSRRMDRGWKLAPSSKRFVDATVWYLDRISVQSDGARVKFT